MDVLCDMHADMWPYCKQSIDLAPFERLVVAWSAVVGFWISRGSGGCVVGCGWLWRLRRCLIVNCNRFHPVRESGDCLVGCGRLWSAAVLSYWVWSLAGIPMDFASVKGSDDSRLWRCL